MTREKLSDLFYEKLKAITEMEGYVPDFGGGGRPPATPASSVHKLKVQYNMELAQDMKAMHGIDVSKEMLDMSMLDGAKADCGPIELSRHGPVRDMTLVVLSAEETESNMGQDIARAYLEENVPHTMWEEYKLAIFRPEGRIKEMCRSLLACRKFEASARKEDNVAV